MGGTIPLTLPPKPAASLMIDELVKIHSPSAPVKRRGGSWYKLKVDVELVAGSLLWSSTTTNNGGSARIMAADSGELVYQNTEGYGNPQLFGSSALCVRGP